MDEITVKNYRCFHEEQTARLAPLTLLVGENSTGKTSFLALIRALWDVAQRVTTPDFKEDPYDLGSFDEIAHHRGGRSKRVDTFEAGFRGKQRVLTTPTTSDQPYGFEVTFGKRGTTPVPVRKRHAIGTTWIEELSDPGEDYLLRVGTHRGAWEAHIPAGLAALYETEQRSFPFYIHMITLWPKQDQSEGGFIPINGSPTLSSNDQELLESIRPPNYGLPARRPFASAPVRSKPRRTYDPSRATMDPEGDYVPMYLANVFAEDRTTWNNLKITLEIFGRAAGLFDEITIKRLGEKGSEPFQVQLRKFDRGQRGPRHNLIDVGYGVSQVLPVITELLRPDPPAVSLLQQPEVHLHPSAQAALGSLFCYIASQPGRQLVVETHSDHLLDRVRMAVRDDDIEMGPGDVSILFFERIGLDVKIHSITIDEDGNIDGQPPGYRRFFMEETQRSLGL